MKYELVEERGWIGAFTRDQAPGAIANGARIVKQNSEVGDTHPDGVPGVVLGSVPVGAAAPNGKYAKMGYFIEWAPKPRIAVFVADFKIRQASV